MSDILRQKLRSANEAAVFESQVAGSSCFNFGLGTRKRTIIRKVVKGSPRCCDAHSRLVSCFASLAGLRETRGKC